MAMDGHSIQARGEGVPGHQERPPHILVPCRPLRQPQCPTSTPAPISGPNPLGSWGRRELACGWGACRALASVPALLAWGSQEHPQPFLSRCSSP